MMGLLVDHGRAGFADRIDCLLTVDGRKPHRLADTLGLPLALGVHAANIRDRDGLAQLATASAGGSPG